MIAIARRRRSQPPPARFIHEALTDPDRDPSRPWLTLRRDEQRPRILESEPPHLVVWCSIWPWRPDAQIRFDVEDGMLEWTLYVDEPEPDGETVVRMRKRINELINANLRFTFGQ
ncbi:hypothetical protein [Rhodococcus gannanensis]|uniref:Uncharacterized protein n=1 Tax=Rhodococcus gannanensis TaxID=1960308 RepID=A0ABW4P6Q9_9NOCA